MADPQTSQFLDTYYDAMIGDLTDAEEEMGKSVEENEEPFLTDSELENRNGRELIEKRKDRYANDVEAFYEDYQDERAYNADYEYNESEEPDTEYYNNEFEDGKRLHDILYDVDAAEGREIPEEKVEENDSKVDIREFTLMISKLLFRLAQM